MQNKEATKTASGRDKKRVPITGKQPLAVRGKEPGYMYRVVNDVDDRILEMQDAGYEVVRGGDATVGDKRVDRATEPGTVKQFSVGGGTKAVLMRIPEEWYHEDQEAKMSRLKSLEDSTKKDALNGNYGKLDVSRD